MTQHTETSEKAIEKFFVESLKKISIPCIKQFNPYEAGWPDRLVLLRGGRCWWVEFKSKGKRPTPQQRLRHAQLEAIGHSIDVVSTRTQAEELLEKILLSNEIL